MSKLFDDTAELLLTHIRRQYQSFSALFVILFLLVLVFVYVLVPVDWDRFTPSKLFVLAGLISTVTLAWVIARRVPKAPKNSIGLVIAFTAEEPTQLKKFRADFIGELRQLLSAQLGTKRITIVELGEYHAARVCDEESAKRYLDRCRSQMILFGTARLRLIDGVDHHVLRLNGMVRHSPIPIHVGQAFAREFSEVMPQSLRISSENDLLSFEFTAKWISVVSKYIIGIASVYSLDPLYAKELFESVQESIAGTTGSRADPIGKLKDRLPTRLSECYGFLAKLEHKKWRDSRLEDHLLQLRNWVQHWLRVQPNSYSALLLDAICQFGIDRNIGAAIGTLRKCRAVAGDDPTWRYSLAFLHAYREELQQAEWQYKCAFRNKALDAIAIEVEEFLLWVLEAEKEKWQLHYCLALLNHYAKEDIRRAIEEYELFLSKCGGARKFRREQGRSQSAVAELRLKMQDLERVSYSHRVEV